MGFAPPATEEWTEWGLNLSRSRTSGVNDQLEASSPPNRPWPPGGGANLRPSASGGSVRSGHEKPSDRQPRRGRGMSMSRHRGIDMLQPIDERGKLRPKF